MICDYCSKAADIDPGNGELVTELHKRCGDRCPCQHRGTPSERRAGVARELEMQALRTEADAVAAQRRRPTRRTRQ